MHAIPKAREHSRRQNPRNQRFYRITKTDRSNLVIVKVEGDIARAKAVGPDKLGITRRTLVLRVAGQHALDAQADTLNILYRRPSLRGE
jgi:hypothetical protein